jgi:hypothetical protein
MCFKGSIYFAIETEILPCESYVTFPNNYSIIFVENSIVMSNAFFKTPIAINEPVKAYAPGSAERNSLIQTYKDMWSQAPVDVPMYIGGKEVRTNTKKAMNPPHDHAHVLGHYNAGDASHVTLSLIHI